MSPRTEGVDGILLSQVLAGKAVPYSRPGSLSAINKQPVEGIIRVTKLGIDVDQQGDLRVHGGPDKAIHHYPLDHYPYWKEHVRHELLENPGAFGENFSSSGWTESEVHIGDVVRVGKVTLQISQGRQPCWKLNDRFNEPGMARRMQSSGRTGWYYRVLGEGTLHVGDEMTVIERPCPQWSMSRLINLLFDKLLDHDLLEQARHLPLTPSWLKLVTHRLEKNQVESWSGRLDGPSRSSDGA